MNEKIEHLKLSSIIEDYDYSVRKTIDSHTVNKYANNMKAGAQFPPLILEAKTKKIVCGFNRFNAYIKVFEPDHEVPVILKNYKSSKELFEEAVKDNTTHGMPLTRWDIQNIICRSEKLGFEFTTISKLLNMPEYTLEKIADKTVLVIDSVGEKEVMPIKSKYKSGIDINKKGEITENEYQKISNHGSGWNIIFHLNQILMNLELKSFIFDEKTKALMENTANELLKFIKKAK